MKSSLVLAIFAAVILFAVQLVSAEGVPTSINYQGRLTDDQGNPVVDGEYQIVFTIYNAETEGDILWASDRIAIEVSNGLFTHKLGPLPDDLFSEGTSRYLGIRVEGEDIEPRTQLITVPYAYHSLRADSAGVAAAAFQIQCDGCITDQELGPNSVGAEELAPDAVTSENIQNGAIQFDDIGQNGAAAGQIVKWSGAVWEASDDETGGIDWNWSDSSSHGPDSVLYADTSTYAESSEFASSAGFADSTDAITDGAVDLADIGQNGATGSQIIRWDGTMWSVSDDETGGWIKSGNVVRLVAESDSVGIGTSTPSAKLDVAGDILVSGKATIGDLHTNTGLHSFVAGNGNTATDQLVTISGGTANTADGFLTVIGGGKLNSIIGDRSTIGGGVGNSVTADTATIGGGGLNEAGADGAAISGGVANIATGRWSTVGGGDADTAAGWWSTVGGGRGNRAEFRATVSGGVTNVASADGAVVGGGLGCEASGEFSTVSGGLFNYAIADHATCSGGNNNGASGTYSTCAGGDHNGASGSYAAVGGGHQNDATNTVATVCGGEDNDASAFGACITGGQLNISAGLVSSVGGGYSNSALGDYSAVPGGRQCSATGEYSFTAGRQAKALHDGSFVWADGQAADFASTTTDQFNVRAQNGVRISEDAGSAKSISYGERYRDNSIVAWARVTSTGTLSIDFGVTSVTRNSAGDYTITIDAAAAGGTSLMPFAIPEVDGAPAGAASARIAMINQKGSTNFDVYIMNGNFAMADNDFVFMVTGR
jgi:hypothetical protein